MAYSLFTQSLGADNANAKVTITEVGTGLPALILANSTGGMVNDRGITSLDSSGNLSIYIDTARTWKVTVIDEVHPDLQLGSSNKVLPMAQIDTFKGQVGAIYTSDTKPHLLYTWDGEEMRPLTPFSRAEIASLSSFYALSTSTRVFPTWQGIQASTIQFRGATDTVASLGTLGIVVDANNDAEAGSLLAAGAAEETSTINGASSGGNSYLIPMEVPASTVHIGQISMLAPYSLVTSGTVDAATREFIKLDFPEPVNYILWTEYGPTNYAGTPGTGSARYVSIVGLLGA